LHAFKTDWHRNGEGNFKISGLAGVAIDERYVLKVKYLQKMNHVCIGLIGSSLAFSSPPCMSFSSIRGFRMCIMLSGEIHQWLLERLVASRCILFDGISFVIEVASENR
jgi:hypothetical protein